MSEERAPYTPMLPNGHSAIVVDSSPSPAAAPQLSSCPFCGACETVLTDDGSQAWVRCSFCQTTGPLGHTALGAVLAWNKRPAAANGSDAIVALFEDVLTNLRRVTLMHDPMIVRCLLTATLEEDLATYRRRLTAVLGV